jgi:hypothetical protein
MACVNRYGKSAVGDKRLDLTVMVMGVDDDGAGTGFLQLFDGDGQYRSFVNGKERFGRVPGVGPQACPQSCGQYHGFHRFRSCKMVVLINFSSVMASVLGVSPKFEVI